MLMGRNLLIVLVFFAGIIGLQLFLSKKTSKWLGLILPTITLLYSIISVLSIVDTGNILQNITLIVTTLLIYNISTAILMAIYFACREKLKRKAQLEKMNIQDLE